MKSENGPKIIFTGFSNEVADALLKAVQDSLPPSSDNREESTTVDDLNIEEQ